MKDEKTLAYSIGTGSRLDIVNTKHERDVPGPGNYAQDGLAHVKSAPKFGFGTSSRNDANNKLNGPGPGNYSMKNFTGDEMPKFSMGTLNSFDPVKKESKSKPGPGNYSPMTKKATSYTIGKGTRRDHAKEKA